MTAMIRKYTICRVGTGAVVVFDQSAVVV